MELKAFTEFKQINEFCIFITSSTTKKTHNFPRLINEKRMFFYRTKAQKIYKNIECSQRIIASKGERLNNFNTISWLKKNLGNQKEIKQFLFFPFYYLEQKM